MFIAALAISLTVHAEDGDALLRRINAAHRGTWFTSLIFVQRTTWPGTERPEETWYETMQRPGYLRLDMERGGQMVGRAIFRSDSIYQETDGRPPIARPLLHPLLLLLHDIHVGNADSVIAKVRTLGFDLSRTGEATWNGAKVITVGGWIGDAVGDTAFRQFWVDPERLVVVRIIQSATKSSMNDVRIGRFSREGDALVEREISFLTNGRETLLEEYTWVRTGSAIPASVFDPASRELPAWIAEYKSRAQRP
jgi:hypothetical protein